MVVPTTRWLATACLLLGAARAVTFEEVLDLDSETALKDPILWKTRHAAQFAASVARGEKLAPAKDAVELEVGNTTLLVAASDAYHLVLAFADHGGSFQSIDDDDFSNVPFAQSWLEGLGARESVMDTFMKYAEGNSDGEQVPLRDMADEILPNGRPSNVLCAGQEGGGAFVPLCALWAAFTWPNAHITAVSFGSPWPGNAKFNWTMTQLVDQYFFWPASDEAYGAGSLSAMSLDDVLQSLSGGLFDRATSFKEDEVEEGVHDMIRDAVTIKLYDASGQDITYKMEPVYLANDTSVSEEEIEVEGEAYDAVQLNQTIADWYAVENECPLVLCKTRFPSVLQATIYERYDPNRPDDTDLVRLDEVLPGAVMVLDARKDADGAVAWNETTETAYFIFRGSESTRDWVVDFNILQSNYDVKSTAQNQVFEEPDVAMGFKNQFEALTQSDDPKINFASVLADLNNGATPKVVVCTGQSLGGALSTLCGPWAQNTYPTSSVLVINEGSPKVGDDDFVFYFKALVGNAYRFVHEKDQVPLLAPRPEYQHVGRGIFIDGNDVIMQDRPELKMWQSDWKSHNYYIYSIKQTNVDNVTIPSYVYDLEDGEVTIQSNTAGSTAAVFAAAAWAALATAAASCLLFA